MRTKGDVLTAIFAPEQAMVVKFKADLYAAILKAAAEYTRDSWKLFSMNHSLA